MKSEIERMKINYTFYFFHYGKMNKIFPSTHPMPYKTYGKDKNEPKGTLLVAKGTLLVAKGTSLTKKRCKRKSLTSFLVYLIG